MRFVQAWTILVLLCLSAVGQIVTQPPASSATPSGAASGDLGGNYPGPTVVKLNGTALSGLATGILKNTTGTGVPSIAGLSDFPSIANATFLGNTSGGSAAPTANVFPQSATVLGTNANGLPVQATGPQVLTALGSSVIPALNGGSGASYLTAGALTESIVAADGYYINSVNMAQLGKNNLATYNGNQYIGYANTSLHVIIIKRNLTSGALSKFDTGFLVSSDEHDNVAISLDKNGFIHLCYGMHASALLYRKSTNAEDPSAFSAVLSMLGTNETSVTYPMFVKHPSTGELYFSFRDGGSGTGDQYFYHYNAGTVTWEAASGSGTAGIIINGKVTPVSAYLNGLPKWDSSGSNLWWSWSWGVTGGPTGIKNEYLMKWTGSAFTKANGSAQTIPATDGNLTAVETIGTTLNLSPQNDFFIDSSGNIYIAYCKDDASANRQVFVAVVNSSTGAVVERQLTNNIGAFSVSRGTLGISVVSIGSFSYVLYPDVFSKETGVVAWRSTDAFVTSTKFYVAFNYNPNSAIIYDPIRLQASNILSFMFQDTDDATFGVVYVPIGSADLGQITVLEWAPSADAQLAKGIPRDLLGLNSIQALTINTNTINQNRLLLTGDSSAGITSGPVARFYDTAANGQARNVALYSGDVCFGCLDLRVSATQGGNPDSGAVDWVLDVKNGRMAIGPGVAAPVTAMVLNGPLDVNNGQLRIQDTTNDQSALTMWSKLTSPTGTARNWQISVNNAAFGNLEIDRSTSSTGNPITVVAEFDSSGNLGLTTGEAYTWGTIGGSKDTRVSRDSAGVVCFDTTATDNCLGSARLANLTASGASSAATYLTATNCSNAASPAVCGSAAAGAVAIPTGVTSVVLQVNTTAVTANSRITLLSDDSLTIAATTCNSTLATLVGGLVVTARNPGVSFTITYNGTIATNPLCVSYTIVD